MGTVKTAQQDHYSFSTILNFIMKKYFKPWVRSRWANKLFSSLNESADQAPTIDPNYTIVT